MGKRCVVQKCTTGRGTEKHSLFRVPKDVERRKLWQKITSMLFKDEDVVCDKHFHSKYILREWVHKDSSGKIIAKVPYGHPRLAENAVPTIFVQKSIEDHNYARITEMVDYSETMEPEIPNDSSNPKSPIPATSSNQSNLTIIQSAKVSATEPNESIKAEHQVAKKPPSELPVAPQPTTAIAVDKTDKTPSVPSSTVKNKNKEKISTTESTYRKYLSLIPPSWSVSQLPVVKKIQIVFSHMIIVTINGVHVPIAQKSVTMDSDKNLRYFVYGRPITMTQQVVYAQTLIKDESIAEILVKFERTNICYGIGNVGQFSVMEDIAFQDHIQQWRDKSCTMIWKRKRCEACLRLRKRVLQQTSRAKSRTTLCRIRMPSNPADQFKLIELRKKYRREKRKSDRAKARQVAMESISSSATPSSL